MLEENEIKNVEQVTPARGRTGDAVWTLAQRAHQCLRVQLGWPRDAGVMGAEGLQAMRIGSREKRPAMGGRDFSRAAVQVEPALVKMAELDGVEAIHFLEKPVADRRAEEKKRVWRKTEKGVAPLRTEPAQIGKSVQTFDFVRLDIEEHDIRAFQPHFRRLDEENSHRRGVSKDLRSIEYLFVQGDSERAETQLAGPFQELMRGVIEPILGIVERVDVQIDFDPILFLLGRTLDLSSYRHRLTLNAGSAPRWQKIEEAIDFRRRGNGNDGVAERREAVAFLRS